MSAWLYFLPIYRYVVVKNYPWDLLYSNPGSLHTSVLCHLSFVPILYWPPIRDTWILQGILHLVASLPLLWSSEAFRAWPFSIFAWSACILFSMVIGVPRYLCRDLTCLGTTIRTYHCSLGVDLSTLFWWREIMWSRSSLFFFLLQSLGW